MNNRILIRFADRSIMLIYAIDISAMLLPDPDVFTIIHFASFSGLALYGLHRLWFLILWFRERRLQSSGRTSSLPALPPGDFPCVTVQLPLFNERFVAERLLDAAARLDWPKEKLEIQVLDDSTDDTRNIIDDRVAYWLRDGINMKVIRRTGREGYKAGALSHGLAGAEGTFIAVFDADFIPPGDFLLRSVAHFSRADVGMVQARWGFLNEEHSWLTRLQSLLLGPHFRIEHWIRYRRGLFFNFNGTAGIWRRQAIEDAGGWQADTVTEDLDLSYRAQLAGWRFVYLDDLVVPSELPVTIAAFRSQQQRWAKGSVQTARKILPDLIRSSLPLKIKIEAVAHLLANICWLLGAVVTLTLFPVMHARVDIGLTQIIRLDLPFFLTTSCSILMYFFLYAIFQKGRGWLLSPLLLPLLTVGLAPSIALSVLRGIVRGGGVFERTPKFGLRGRQGVPVSSFLYRQQTLPYIIMNSILFSYSLLPLLFVWQRSTWVALPFVMLFPLGFAGFIIKDLLSGREAVLDSSRNTEQKVTL